MMWEITVSESYDKLYCLDFIYARLNAQVKFVGGIIVKQNIAGRCQLSLAVPKKQKDYFVLLLLELISEVITQNYKRDYLYERLNPISETELTKTAFVKALTVFDKQTDKDLIKKQLVLCGEINIDSFYYFKLHALRNRWQDICNLVNDNISSFEPNKTIREFLKFLIKTTETSYDEVHMYKKNQEYYLTDSHNRPITDLVGSEEKGEVKALEELITLSPAKIILHGEAPSKDPFYDYIFNLFDDKVYIPV
ncbi:MAG: hypothetical protein IJS68_02635 [Clostridia bacterium]|nr:hypothetical protein [Clostridia bacterium]